MPYVQLIVGLTQAQYQVRFEQTYCCGPITTFDGIAVRFRKNDFGHAFFESTGKLKKNTFSTLRAERMDWIKAALQDPQAELYWGFDRKKQCYTNKRRVAIVNRDYVVVIALTGPKTATFITAFMDTGPLPGRNFSSLQMIRMGPKWP